MQGDPERPALSPANLFLNAEQFFATANQYAQLALRPYHAASGETTFAQSLPDLMVVRGATDPLERLELYAKNTAHRLLILAESDGRRESLLDFLRASELTPVVFDSLHEFEKSQEKIGIATSSLQVGFSWLEAGIDFITETELFAIAPAARRRKKQEQVSDVEALIKDLSELNVGDPVVHNAHGIGRYRGLVNMDLGEKTDEGHPAQIGRAHV